MQQAQLKEDVNAPTKIQRVPVMCVFCQQVAGSAGLHDASTNNLDFKIRNCAADLNDTQLLSRLYTDVVAIRMKYHTTCLAKIYKRAEQVRKKQNLKTHKQMSDAYMESHLLNLLNILRATGTRVNVPQCLKWLTLLNSTPQDCLSLA